METIVIGIDGGEWDILHPLIEDGHLPNFASLIEDGYSGSLESVSPPVSPPAWNSINTGMNPGKHGIFDFSKFDSQYRRRSVNATDRQATPFWEILNGNSISTGLFKVPFTYPPREVNGFIVSGFPTPSKAKNYAKPLSIEEKIGDSDLLFEDWSYQSDGEYGAFRDNLIEVAERQTDLLLEILEEYPVEFLMTVFDGADRLQHFFWKYFDQDHPRYIENHPLSDAITEYFKTVDEGIGELLSTYNNDPNVLIISDHGFGPLTHDVYIDEWLEQRGFIERYNQYSTDNLTTNIAAKLLEMSWNAIKQAGLGSLVKSISPEKWFKKGEFLKNEGQRSIDWEKSSAFFTTLSGQSIHVNLKDQFVHGIVGEEERESVLNDLESSLKEMEDPNSGEVIVEDVVRTEDIFEGWAVTQGPDLIINASPKYTFKEGHSNSLVTPSTQNSGDRSGDHRKDGILIASGPEFQNAEVSDASILDISPTILHLHDCPVPRAMDGDVLLEIFDQKSKYACEVEYTSKYGQENRKSRRWSAEEEEELEDQLSAMGYLG